MDICLFRKSVLVEYNFLSVPCVCLISRPIVCILLNVVLFLFSLDSPTELFGSDLLFKKRKEIMRFKRVLIFFF